MSAKANYFKLGLFIIVAVVLAIGAVLLLGASKLFVKKVIMETYLDQSVQGIEVGSKVKFRGVTIGTIRKIDFTRNRYEEEKLLANRHSYVLLELEIRGNPFRADTATIIERQLAQEIEHGLRARITSQGVTGTSYIEVDYLDPARYPPLPIDWTPYHPYIPSAPSVLSRLFSSVEDVFDQLQKIDFERIAGNVDSLISSVDKKVEELPVNLIGTNAVSLLAEVRESNQRVQKLLDGPEIKAVLTNTAGAMAGLRRTVESPDITNSLAQVQKTLRRMDELIAGKDNDLQVSLDNLRALTENLKELSENAKRFPAQVLFGEPPKPSKNSQ
jgi:ABC-type transporter Mla subunit MlaD